MGVLIKAALANSCQNDYLLPVQPLIKDALVDDVYPDQKIIDSSDVLEITEETHAINEEPDYVNKHEKEEVQPLTQLELDEIKNNAREEAYRLGYEQSVSDVNIKYKDQLEAFDSVLMALNAAIPEYIEKSEAMIAAIVFESVCKIVGEVLINQSKSLEVVKQILIGLDIKKVREVFINQSDFEAIEDLKKNFSLDKEPSDLAINQFEFKVDSTIRYGGCKVKLVDGYLNATIDEQLAALSKILTKKVEELSGG